MSNEEYPIDENMQGRRDSGWIEKLLPEPIAEVLRHRTISGETVTWEFENVIVSYKGKFV